MTDDETRTNDGFGDKHSPLDELLVAYLDGELDVEGSRRVETMLASDSGVRRRLHEMQRTWDLLDDLDAVPVSGVFTQSTLEMVAVAAGEDLDRSRAAAPRRHRRRLAAIAGSLIVAIAIGFIAVLLATPDPNRQLLQDLPLLLNLDDYRQIDDIAFLRLLRDQTPFGAEKGASPAVAPVWMESLAQRRQRVQRMTDAEKEQLARLQDRWASLDGSEQRRVRELHEAILRSPDAGQLLDVMHRYCDWLQTMPSYRWIDLAGGAPAARIEAVNKRLAEERARNDTRRLSDKETQTLLRWMDKIAAKHEAQFIATLPPERQASIRHLSQDERRRMMLRSMSRRWQPSGPGSGLVLTAEELADLRQQLDPETGTWLGSKTEPDQVRIVTGWMHRATRQRYHRGPLNPSDELLADFFVGLSLPEQERLLVLPGEEMQRLLLQMYLRHTRPAEARPQDAGRPPGGTRQGPRHGPPKKNADASGRRP